MSRIPLIYFLISILFSVNIAYSSANFQTSLISTINDNNLRNYLQAFFDKIKTHQLKLPEETSEITKYYLINFLSILKIQNTKQKVQIEIKIRIIGHEYYDRITKKNVTVILTRIKDDLTTFSFLKKNNKIIMNNIPEYYPLKFINK